MISMILQLPEPKTGLTEKCLHMVWGAGREENGWLGFWVQMENGNGFWEYRSNQDVLCREKQVMVLQR